MFFPGCCFNFAISWETSPLIRVAGCHVSTLLKVVETTYLGTVLMKLANNGSSVAVGQ